MPEGGVAERLGAAGLVLPPHPTPKGAYVPAVRFGDLVFTAGQLPVQGGVLLSSGKVGDAVSLETARRCARVAALNALAAASTVCDLDEVRAVLKLVGYVSCTAAFTAQPGVIDAASDVLLAAFEMAGRHAREAVGVRSLPLDAPVEVSLVLGL